MTVRQIVLDAVVPLIGQYVEVHGINWYGIQRRTIGRLVSVQMFSSLYLGVSDGTTESGVPMEYKVMSFYVIHRRREVELVSNYYATILKAVWSCGTR